MINLAARLTGVNPQWPSQHTNHRISYKSPMALKSPMTRILVMAEEIDVQKPLLVVINKTVLFQKVVR